MQLNLKSGQYRKGTGEEHVSPGNEAFLKVYFPAFSKKNNKIKQQQQQHQ